MVFISLTGRDGRLQKISLFVCDFSSLLNIIRVISSRRMRGTWCVGCLRDSKCMQGFEGDT